MDAAAIRAFSRFLDRIEALLDRLATTLGAGSMLAARPAPDRFTAGQQLAIAIGFAARGLCPVAGRDVPDIGVPDDIAGLRTALQTVRHAIDGITVETLRPNPITHRAGQADLTQPPDEFLLHYALPNMLFHFSMAYAALAQAGLVLSKGDFDGLHHYEPGFRF